MKKLVVLTGAGVSAESGLRTYRDSDGLWEQYKVMDVASIEGWQRDPALMIRFYNDRRRQLSQAQPNEGHRALAELEKNFEVVIVTQNVDDLHERAGSTHVIHLHGELTKMCSSRDKTITVDVGYEPTNYGDKAPDGSILRPFIVWFGEAVPMMGAAEKVTRTADLFAVVGTSLVVYPAAGLVNCVPGGTPSFLVDPKEVDTYLPDFTQIKEPASTGVPKMRDILLEKYA